VNVVVAVGADEEAAAVVEPGEGALDDPTLTTQPRAVFGLAAGNDRLDAALPDEAPILVVVVAAVRDQRPRAASWAADAIADGRDPIEQFEELGNVVTVAASERPGERSATAVYEQVVLAPGATAINGAGTGLAAPFFA
jgi:hypothetical protein